MQPTNGCGPPPPPPPPAAAAAGTPPAGPPPVAPEGERDRGLREVQHLTKVDLKCGIGTTSTGSRRRRHGTALSEAKVKGRWVGGHEASRKRHGVMSM